MADKQQIDQLADHIFRHEAGKLVSVLTGVFGVEHINLAEDVVQDSLVEAIENWQYNGVPNDPSAWLYRVAKNKALNVLNRETYKRKYATEIAYQLKAAPAAEPVIDHLFTEQEIQDDQLRMIFTCCHPSISPDSQIALALKTLCGFSIPEIAKAFLTTEENINKRLVRARQNIRDAKVPFEVPQGKELEQRLQTVLETIYLLFNEGYSASRGDEVIRYELCEEAIRLAQMVADSKSIAHQETVFALLSLMLLHASRFNARLDKEGNLLTLAEQDRSLWDQPMQRAGLFYLNQAAQNNSISIYHILAAIAAQYCVAPNYESIDWESILSLYDSLMILDNSPVVLLNRAIAISKVRGAETALKELEKIQDIAAIKSYYLFYSTQAEFYIQQNKMNQAIPAIEKAIELAPLQSEKELLKKKLKLYKMD